MSVRNAVAVRDQAAVAATDNPARTPLAHVARDVVDRQREMLAAILPRGADPDRFKGMALQAIKKTPALLRCFETEEGQVSFVVAMNQAAIAGLEPNTPTEDCWILPRKVRYKDERDQWQERQEAELQISYKGFIRLAYRSPRIASVDAAAVYEADDFEHYWALPHDVFRHRESPQPRSERGELTHAWCLVRYVNGANHLTVLDREQVLKRREMSESWLADQRRAEAAEKGGYTAKQHSPWNTWEEEMWMKTAVRAARAFMDLTVEAAEAIESEGMQLGYDRQRQVVTTRPFQPDGPTTGRELTDARDLGRWADAAAALEAGAPDGQEQASTDTPADGPQEAGEAPATPPATRARSGGSSGSRGGRGRRSAQPPEDPPHPADTVAGNPVPSGAGQQAAWDGDDGRQYTTDGQPAGPIDTTATEAKG